MNTKYINTDLELESHQDLTQIVDFFGDDVFNLYNGAARNHYLATFEVSDGSSPDSAIKLFCMLVEEFDSTERKIWDECFSRVFHIGYEGGIHHQSYTDEIKTETLLRVSKIKASIRITIYPVSNEENNG